MTSESVSMAMGDAVQTLTVAGQRFVLLPESEYRRLQNASGENGPELPPPDAQGNYPAVATLRAMIARDIVQHRRALGLSQAELARRAGIRVETLNRIEQGKYSPRVRTIEQLDRALKAAENDSKPKAPGRRARK